MGPVSHIDLQQTKQGAATSQMGVAAGCRGLQGVAGGCRGSGDHKEEAGLVHLTIEGTV